MSLDDLARSATTELLERTSPPLDVLLPELRRTRRRRTAQHIGMAVLALLLVTIGSAALLREPTRDPDPVEPVRPGEVSNGALVARIDGPLGLRTVSGELAHLPVDDEPYSAVTFTADGSEIVYSNDQKKMTAVDVETGAIRTLGDCTWAVCDGALAPDGQRLATGAPDGVWITTVDTGRTVLVPTPGTAGAAFPRWSPDGQQLAFVSRDGIYVMRTDGTDLRQVHASETDPGDQPVSPPPSWSPDGRALAFLEATPRGAEPGRPPYDFTVMTVRTDGSRLTSVHAAGHCYCLGLPAPALTWSPDGQMIAVAVSQMKSGPGVYVVAPDGSGWEQLASAVYGTTIAWQPVTE